MRSIFTVCALGGLVLPTPSLAWGNEGHQIVAIIARSYLTPAVRAKVDAILATDTDTLTAHDMASEATWADAFRAAGHRETAAWHFVDQETDGSADLKAACFNFPPANQPASSGPVQDCVVDKINEFSAELHALGTTPAERLLALKFLLHFVGDVHQPLHAADNRDRGGNCVLVSLGGSRTVNLHAYWDTVIVNTLGTDPTNIAATLRARITSTKAKTWRTGNAASWAAESFGVAKRVAYAVKTPSGCGAGMAPIQLPAGYQATATIAAATQLERAGVRLAAVLNNDLGKEAAK